MDEYIRREDAINCVKWATDERRGISIIDFINELPVADVRPVVHGEWLPVDDLMDAFDCSECDVMVMKRHNFCPNCGADMRPRNPEKQARERMEDET